MLYADILFKMTENERRTLSAIPPHHRVRVIRKTSYTTTLLLASAMTLLHGTVLAVQSYSGPMIDAHGHLGDSFDWEIMVKTMDRNNVPWRTIMARYYPGGSNDLASSDEAAVRLAERYPGRFFPLIGMQRPLLTGSHKWRTPNREVNRLIKETERKLATGKFYGIGELIVRHWSYSRGVHAEQDNPIYSTFMQRMSEVGARFDVPLVIHMEGYPALVDDFSRLLSEHPKARFVWAHNCGRSQASVVRDMLARHPNLYCDLAGMTNVGRTGYGIGWPRKEEFTALIEEGGVLYPEMKTVFEEFPDRFMLGMDVAHAQGNNLKNYSRRVHRFRVLLGQLNPDTARKFAESNAIRIFRISPSTAR